MNYSTLQNKNNSLILKLSLVVCLLISGFGFAQETAKAGQLTFETEEIDYGTIAQHADGERTFKFTNTGEAPIVISNVKTSCGCTVPEYSRTPILPGETSEITVKYATNRLGVFKKTITVMSNADQPTKVLKIKGEVLKSDTEG
ncbi:DUF1573 domain-containing protein [Gaetbulibacter jejuensis]|jgi:hypothetical protein|uniref:DUF1573 domain-containing protein n=1 Tax=Gaetbulibacter jejuensis TaxID=584607 RepID=A0ABN1JXZ6_9FLAO